MLPAATSTNPRAWGLNANLYLSVHGIPNLPPLRGVGGNKDCMCTDVEAIPALLSAQSDHADDGKH